jgi:superfamily I DNA/RNA helicase
MPIVALADEFLEAFARLPRAKQRKVQQFLEKFRANPRSPGINYEKIHAAKDDRVRTVRIDQQYRAVVLHPDQGDVYVLAWVDNHDEAMDWAGRRTFAVNPATGALQVVNVQAAEAAAESTPRRGRQPGLLDAFGDEVLVSLGVPEALLPAVRVVQNAQALQAVSRHLPAEAAEALHWLAEGIPVEEVHEAVAAPDAGRVDTTDLVTALQHPDSRRRFVTVESEQDLESILEAPLAKWRLFLHPSQERLVKKQFSGPARVTGGPGTGKTVVAMHRARHLATKVFTAPGDRVLFTTYTTNLAQNIEELLASLCGPDAGRIEVANLHAWAVRFLRDQGIGVEVASSDDQDACWGAALARHPSDEWDEGFLRQEWEQVVQANDITTLPAYLQVARTGRGRTLTRPQRGRLWQVFEAYRDGLKDRNRQEWVQVIRTARRVLEQRRPALPYRAVVVDESQDLHPEEWRLIRAVVPEGANDLFMVGDSLQRIYGRRVVLRDCGIAVTGRSSTLRINYRTTEQIRAWAVALASGREADDLDGGVERRQGEQSLLSGPKPEVRHFATRREELAFLEQLLPELTSQRQPEEVCLVARTAKLLRDDYQPLLRGLGIPHTVLDKGREYAGSGLRLATMHRVKGLEFPVMIVAAVNAGVVPMRVASAGGDPTARAEHEERERSLLFVAATRARDHLIVTSFGTASPFLAALAKSK